MSNHCDKNEKNFKYFVTLKNIKSIKIPYLDIDDTDNQIYDFFFNYAKVIYKKKYFDIVDASLKYLFMADSPPKYNQENIIKKFIN